jgi:Protein of unknown function (DUF1444)
MRQEGLAANMNTFAYISAFRPAEAAASRLEIPAGSYPVTKNLHNGLIVNYLIDVGPNFVYVSHDALAASGLDAEGLHKLATDNLAKMANERMSVQQHNEMYFVTMGGHFEASLLLVDDLWDQRFRSLVQGQVVVAIPARDILAFGDPSSGLAMTELNALLRRSRENHVDHRITNTLYARVGQAWQPKT